MERFRVYRCKVKMRPTYEGRPLKASVGELEGKELNLECMWRCHEDENYPGEYALGGANNEAKQELLAADITWIASGDVEVLGLA